MGETDNDKWHEDEAMPAVAALDLSWKPEQTAFLGWEEWLVFVTLGRFLHVFEAEMC